MDNPSAGSSVINVESIHSLCDAELKTLIDNAYREGYKDAVRNYAVWRAGEQYVGVLYQPLNTVLQEVDQSEIPIRY